MANATREEILEINTRRDLSRVDTAIDLMRSSILTMEFAVNKLDEASFNGKCYEKIRAVREKIIDVLMSLETQMEEITAIQQVLKEK